MEASPDCNPVWRGQCDQSPCSRNPHWGGLGRSDQIQFAKDTVGARVGCISNADRGAKNPGWARSVGSVGTWRGLEPRRTFLFFAPIICRRDREKRSRAGIPSLYFVDNLISKEKLRRIQDKSQHKSIENARNNLDHLGKRFPRLWNRYLEYCAMTPDSR